MISSRYRYRPVTVPLQFLGLIKHRYLTVTSPLPYRYLPLLTLLIVTHLYSSLLIVTDRYSPLLTVTVTHRFFGNLIFFHSSFKSKRILKVYIPPIFKTEMKKRLNFQKKRCVTVTVSNGQ